MRKARIGIVAVAAMIGTPVLAADMAVKARNQRHHRRSVGRAFMLALLPAPLGSTP